MMPINKIQTSTALFLLFFFFAKYQQIGAHVNCCSMRFGNSCAREVMLDYLLGDNKDLIMNVNFLSDPGWIIVFTCQKIKTSIAKSRTNNLRYKSHLLLTILWKNEKLLQDDGGGKLKEFFFLMISPEWNWYIFFCRFGSDELKRNFLAPAIAGDIVSCLGVRFVNVFVFGVFGVWCLVFGVRCKDCQRVCVNYKPHICLKRTQISISKKKTISKVCVL